MSEGTLCIEFGTGWDERVTRVFLIGLGWASGENWAKLSHMCMGENLSEPSAGCCSLVLSSGWGDRAFLFFPCRLFLSSYHKRGAWKKKKNPTRPKFEKLRDAAWKEEFSPPAELNFVWAVHRILRPLWTALQHFDLRVSSWESLQRAVLADPGLGAFLHKES